MTARTLLLNPGPVTLSARVRAALARPDLCHREPEFSALQSAVRDKLLGVYGLDLREWAAIPLTGSGTAAVEAMLASLVPKGARLLVIDNGVYGARMRRIAEIHGIAHQTLEHAWGASVDIARLQRMLGQDARPTHVAVVHHETTTGRLNDLSAISAACRTAGVEILVDAVSSFGAEHIDFSAWGISAAAATANKCLHGVPGISFVVTRRNALAAGAACSRTLYLDLGAYCAQQDLGGTPFTPSVQVLYALDEALDEHRELGGWHARRARYRELMGTVRAGLLHLDVEPLLEDGASSCVLQAFRLPVHVSYQTLHDRLKSAGFVIYAGQGELAKTIFRVSTMGDITPRDMERFLVALEGALRAGTAARA